MGDKCPNCGEADLGCREFGCWSMTREEERERWRSRIAALESQLAEAKARIEELAGQLNQGMTDSMAAAFPPASAAKGEGE